MTFIKKKQSGGVDDRNIIIKVAKSERQLRKVMGRDWRERLKIFSLKTG